MDAAAGQVLLGNDADDVAVHDQRGCVVNGALVPYRQRKVDDQSAAKRQQLLQ
jgi:hypothetical protein